MENGYSSPISCSPLFPILLYLSPLTSSEHTPQPGSSQTTIHQPSAAGEVPVHMQLEVPVTLYLPHRDPFQGIARCQSGLRQRPFQSGKAHQPGQRRLFEKRHHDRLRHEISARRPRPGALAAGLAVGEDRSDNLEEALPQTLLGAACSCRRSPISNPSQKARSLGRSPTASSHTKHWQCLLQDPRESPPPRCLLSPQSALHTGRSGGEILFNYVQADH